MGIIPIYRSIGNFGKKLLTKKLPKNGFPKNACIFCSLKNFRVFPENFSDLNSIGGKRGWSFCFLSVILIQVLQLYMYIVLKVWSSHVETLKPGSAADDLYRFFIDLDRQLPEW